MINHPLATGEDLLQVSGILVLSGGDTLEGSGGKTVLGAELGPGVVLHVLSSASTDVEEELGRNGSEELVGDEGDGTDGDADEVLVPVEGGGADEGAGELDEDDLEDDGDDDDHPEHAVGEDVLKHVGLVVDLSGVELVEDLHEDEGVEDEGVVLGGFGAVAKTATDGDVEEDGTLVDEEEEDEELEEGLADDVSEHESGDQGLVLSVGDSVEELLGGELGGEGEGGEGIHDEVDPEELDGGERGLTEDAGGGEGDDEGDDVDGELELEELTDGVVDVSAPHDGLDDGGEVIIHQDDIGGVLGDGGTGDTHGEADVTLGEGRTIVGTITSDGDDLVSLHETGDEEVLIGGGGTGHDLEGVDELLELALVLDDVVLLELTLVLLVLQALVATTLLALLGAGAVLAATLLDGLGGPVVAEAGAVVDHRGVAEVLGVVGGLVVLDEQRVVGAVAALALVVEVGREHEATSDLTELGAEHGAAGGVLVASGIGPGLVVVDVALLGDGLGGLHVITGDHADEDAGALALLDGVGDLGTDGVLEAEETNEGEVLLDLGAVADALLLLSAEGDGGVEVGGLVEVAVGEGEDTEGLTGHGVDAVLDDVLSGAGAEDLAALLLEVTGEVLELVVAVDEVVADTDDHLGSALDVESVLAVGEADEDGGTLSVGVEGVEADDAGLSGLVVLEGGVLVADVLVVEAEALAPVEQSDIESATDALVVAVLVDGEEALVVHDAVLNEEVVDGLGDGAALVEEGLVLLGGAGLELAEELGLVLLLEDPALDDGHLALGEGTGLIGADGVGASHGFAGGEVADEVHILHHLLDGVGEGDGDGERKTLGNGDDENGDTGDDVADDGAPVAGGPLGLTLGVDGTGAGEELDKVDDDENDDSEDADEGAEPGDLGGEDGELLLERSVLLVVTLDHGSHSTEDGVLADGDDEHGEGTLVALGGGHDEGVLLALGDLVGLTSKLGLVHLDVVAGDVDTIGGDGVSGVDEDDITDHEVVDVDLLLDAVTHDLDELLVVDSVQLTELLILLEIVDGGDVDDDDDGDENGGAIDPAGAPALGPDAEDDGDESGDDQDDQSGVLEGVPDELEVVGALLLDGSVGAVDLLTLGISDVFAAETLGEVAAERGSKALDASEVVEGLGTLVLHLPIEEGVLLVGDGSTEVLGGPAVLGVDVSTGLDDDGSGFSDGLRLDLSNRFRLGLSNRLRLDLSNRLRLLSDRLRLELSNRQFNLRCFDNYWGVDNYWGLGNVVFRITRGVHLVGKQKRNMTERKY